MIFILFCLRKYHCFGQSVTSLVFFHIKDKKKFNLTVLIASCDRRNTL